MGEGLEGLEVSGIFLSPASSTDRKKARKSLQVLVLCRSKEKERARGYASHEGDGGGCRGS